MAYGIVCVLAGFTMASAGIGMHNWQLYAMLILLAVSHALGQHA